MRRPIRTWKLSINIQCIYNIKRCCKHGRLILVHFMMEVREHGLSISHTEPFPHDIRFRILNKGPLALMENNVRCFDQKLQVSYITRKRAKSSIFCYVRISNTESQMRPSGIMINRLWSLIRCPGSRRKILNSIGSYRWRKFKKLQSGSVSVGRKKSAQHCSRYFLNYWIISISRGLRLCCQGLDAIIFMLPFPIVSRNTIFMLDYTGLRGKL